MSLLLHVLAEVASAIADARRARGSDVDVDALREQLRPVPGVEVVTHDGSLLSGVVVVVENVPVVMLCARREPPRSRWARPDAGPLSPAGPTSFPFWDDELSP